MIVLSILLSLPLVSNLAVPLSAKSRVRSLLARCVDEEKETELSESRIQRQCSLGNLLGFLLALLAGFVLHVNVQFQAH
jgi:hypothetical protein